MRYVEKPQFCLITDHDGKLRLAVTTDGVNNSILYRETEADDWRTVATYDFKEGAQPLMFDFDNRSAIVSSNVGRDKAAIYRYDLQSGRERIANRVREALEYEKAFGNASNLLVDHLRDKAECRELIEDIEKVRAGQRPDEKPSELQELMDQHVAAR